MSGIPDQLRAKRSNPLGSFYSLVLTSSRAKRGDSPDTSEVKLLSKLLSSLTLPSSRAKRSDWNRDIPADGDVAVTLWLDRFAGLAMTCKVGV